MALSLSSIVSRKNHKILEFTLKGDPDLLLPAFERAKTEWDNSFEIEPVEIISERGHVTAKLHLSGENDYRDDFFLIFSKIQIP